MTNFFRQFKVISIVLISLFLSTSNAFAKIELSYSAPSSEIKQDETITLDVTLSGVDPSAEYYIRGVFYKPESTQYFGFTQNNQGNWQSDPNTYTQLYKVSGNATNQIHFKADPSSTYFIPNSNYLFKIGRYTSGGSLTWSDQAPSIVSIKSPAQTPTPTPTPSPILTATPTPLPNEVIEPDSTKLSEIMACPNDDQGEWIELFNKTNKTITLQNWKLKDSTDTHFVEINNTIAPYNYLVVRITSAILNNSGDTVRLFSDQNTLVDQMSYSSCQAGTSYISVNGAWQSTQQITQGSANIFTPLVTPTPSSSPDSTRDPDEVLNASVSGQESAEYLNENIFNDDVPIASISASSTNQDETFPKESTSEANATDDSTIKNQHPSPLSRSAAFLLAGCSYVLSAAMLAQKWYNLTSYVFTTVSSST